MRILRRSRVVAGAGSLLLAGAVAGVALALTGGGSAAVKVVPNSVAVLDPQSGRLVADVPVGKRPVAVATGAGGVWVANADEQTVMRIDPKTRKVVSTIGVGFDVSDIAVGFGSVWVADGNDGLVTQIDPKLNGVQANIHLGAQDELAPNPVFSVTTGAGSVWVTRGNTLVRIDPHAGQPTATYPVPPPISVAAGDDAVWVATQDERLLRLDPRTGTRTGSLLLPGAAFSTVVGKHQVWMIVAFDYGQVWSVDSDSVTQVGTTDAKGPEDLALGKDVLWIAETGGTVRRVSAGGKAETIKVGLDPIALAVDASGVWVAVERPS